MSQRSEAAGSPYAAELAAAKKAVSLAARLCQVLVLRSLLPLLCGLRRMAGAFLPECLTAGLFLHLFPTSLQYNPLFYINLMSPSSSLPLSSEISWATNVSVIMWMEVYQLYSHICVVKLSASIE
jgi:hypothetical protein